MKVCLFLLSLLNNAYAADKPLSGAATSKSPTVQLPSELWGMIVDSLDKRTFVKLNLTGKKTLPKNLTNAPIHVDFQNTFNDYISMKTFKKVILHFPQTRSIKGVLVSSLDSKKYFSYLPNDLKTLHLDKVTSAYVNSLEDAAKLPRGLTSLSLRCKVKNLRQLPPNLTHLNFSFFESYTPDAVLGWSGKLDLSYLQVFSNLTSFTLEHYKCAVTNLDSLPTSLRQLHLPVKCTPTVTDESFLALQKLTNLTELGLNQIEDTYPFSQLAFTGDFLHYLPENLTSLNLEKFSKITSDKLGALRRLPLLSLSITLGNFQIDELAASLPTTLTALSISSRQTIPLNKDMINSLARLTSVVDLRLPYTLEPLGLACCTTPRPWTLENLKKYVPD